MLKTSKSNHHQKYDRSEQKHHFFAKINAVCTVVGKPDAYHMLPKRTLELLYRLRDLPFRIEAAPGEQIPDDILKRMRHRYSSFLKYYQVCLLKDGPKVALYHYIGAASTFRLYLNILKDNEFRGAAELKKELAAFASFEEGATVAKESIIAAIAFTGAEWSDLNSRLYWLERKRTLRKYDPFGYENVLLAHSGIPEKRSFSIDGISRPALKACWAIWTYGGILPVQVKPSDIGIPAIDHPVDVYVQMHALKRLNERLDCLDSCVNSLDLCASIDEPKALIRDDGTIMFEHRVCGTKAGYLVAEMLDGVIVIRTFLFITNGGAPEGKRLQELSGIKRLDREFLAIDKLSTFVGSDVRSNKELGGLFREAGCESLFQLRDAVEERKKESIVSSLPMLMKYFGAGTKEDFMMPDPIARLRKKFAAEEEANEGEAD